jgi:hypothetical protein
MVPRADNLHGSSQEGVWTAIGASLQAPSSCNGQPEQPKPPEPVVNLASVRPRRLSRAVLASILLAFGIGLGAFIAGVFLGKDSSTRQTQTQPLDQSKSDETSAVAQLDELPSDEEAHAIPSIETGDVLSEVQKITEGATLPAPNQRELLGPPSPEAGQSSASKPAARPTDSPPEKAPAAKLQTVQPGKKTMTSVRERWASKRRSRLTDVELRQQLLAPPEVDLETIPGTVKRVISLSRKSAGTGIDQVPQLTSRRADLLGLPLRQGNLAHMNPEEALNLKFLSQRLRLEVQNSMPRALGNEVDPRPDPGLLRTRLLDNPLRAAWLRPQAIATFRQLLMHEHRNVRLVLVDILSNIDGRLAGMALAERAVFDLDSDVRLAALVHLQSRPSSEYESTLIEALQYPWPAFADHAAEALVALDLRDAVPKLISLLDTRDLSEPYPVDLGKTRLAMVPELVRINHLRNCLLCHAYSPSATDLVRGLVPHAEHPVPLPSSGARSWGGEGRGSGGSVIVPTFVRADINFLRQDFSVVQPVTNHTRLWPADQRYDYVVRLRPLGAKELLSWQDRVKDFKPVEPQRESLLFALRELTSENPGPSTEDWKRHYSPLTGERRKKPLAPTEQIPHLKDSLVQAPALQQAELLTAFRNKVGSAYDTALAQAIPELKVELQKTARAILADHFYCLPLKKLGEKLGDQDSTVRRAALTVCRQRKLKALVPELIRMLDDDNEDVAKQVHDVLQQFASRDFGPKRGADRFERQEAMAAWRDWWEQQEKQTTANRRRS